MMVLITYDVRTETPDGPRRLRRVAKACQDYGQRVQYSVFECLVDPAQWVQLKQRLIEEIDTDQDSAALLLCSVPTGKGGWNISAPKPAMIQKAP